MSLFGVICISLLAVTLSPVQACQRQHHYPLPFCNCNLPPKRAPPVPSFPDQHFMYRKKSRNEPLQCGSEPAQCRTEPMQCRTEPMQCGSEPAQCRTEPMQCRTEQVQCKSEPMQCRTEPVQCKSEPMQCGNEPEKCENEPMQCESGPMQCDKQSMECGVKYQESSNIPFKSANIPMQCGNIPMQCGNIPMQCGNAPKQCDIGPIQCHAAPQQFKFMPSKLDQCGSEFPKCCSNPQQDEEFGNQGPQKSLNPPPEEECSLDPPKGTTLKSSASFFQSCIKVTSFNQSSGPVTSWFCSFQIENAPQMDENSLKEVDENIPKEDLEGGKCSLDYSRTSSLYGDRIWKPPSYEVEIVDDEISWRALVLWITMYVLCGLIWSNRPYPCTITSRFIVSSDNSTEFY